MDFLLYIGAGAAVGFIVGMTGVGGALMTPLPRLCFPAHTAVGTDLLYGINEAAGGQPSQTKARQLGVGRLLAAGSMPPH